MVTCKHEVIEQLLAEIINKKIRALFGESQRTSFHRNKIFFTKDR